MNDEKWAETIVDKDLGWTVRARPDGSAVVIVEAFEHIGYAHPSGAPLYEHASRSGDEYTEVLGEARWLVRGMVKFDEYAEMQVNDRFCFGNMREAERVGLLFRRLYELAYRHLAHPIWRVPPP